MIETAVGRAGRKKKRTSPAGMHPPAPISPHTPTVGARTVIQGALRPLFKRSLSTSIPERKGRFPVSFFLPLQGVEEGEGLYGAAATAGDRLHDRKEVC